MEKIVKDCNLKRVEQVRDVDQKDGIVSGYFASFREKADAHGDIFSTKAFNRSVSHFKSANNSRISHLYQHREPVGKLIELGTDEKGLYFVSKLSKSTLGRDVLTMYEEGILKEHSVGFYTVGEEQKSEYNLITEAKLIEGSTVLWGADENTPVTSIKELTESALDFESIEYFFSFVNKAINSSTLSDDTLKTLEAKAKELISSLTRESTQTDEENIYTKFLNRLNNG